MARKLTGAERKMFEELKIYFDHYIYGSEGFKMLDDLTPEEYEKFVDEGGHDTCTYGCND